MGGNNDNVLPLPVGALTNPEQPLKTAFHVSN